MSTQQFRPMLAFDAPIEWYEGAASQVDHLWYISRKLDGIRAIVRDGVLVSRTLKPIRNKFTQKQFGRPDMEGLDGELIVGAPSGEGVFVRTSSGVMSEEGEPQVTFHVLDCIAQPSAPFQSRLLLCSSRVNMLRAAINAPSLHLVEQIAIERTDAIAKLEEIFLGEGYEGAILKNRWGPYKFGRSTKREAGMGKLKRFKDSEAVIIGFEELMHNNNVGQTDHLGLLKRSSHQDNKTPAGTLGALKVMDVGQKSWVFNIGTGFDAALRQHIWSNREKLLGKLVKYKYLPIGMVDVPRHPVFLGFRDAEDVG